MNPSSASLLAACAAVITLTAGGCSPNVEVLMSGRGEAVQSPSGGGGSGGAGATTGSGSASPAAWNGAEVASGFVTAPEVATDDVTGPSLAQLAAQGLPVGLVYTSRGSSGDNGARLAMFDAWGSWPPAPLGSVDPGLCAPPSYLGFMAATRREPGNPHAFADLQVPDQDAFSYLSHVDTGDQLGSPGLSYSNIVMRRGTPLSVVSEATGVGQLALVSRPTDGGFALDAGAISGQGMFVPAAACATTPVAADAAAVGQGWMVGAAIGTEVRWSKHHHEHTCADRFGLIGSATHLQFVTVPSSWDYPALPSAVLGGAIDADGVIDRVRLATRSDGAWFVWSTTGVEGAMVGRVDVSGNVVAGPAALGVAGAHLVRGTFTLEHHGNALVAGLVTADADGTSRIHVQMWNDISDLAWETAFDAEGAIDGPMAMMGSPSGDAFLVAWSELAPGATTHRVRGARLDRLSH